MAKRTDLVVHRRKADRAVTREISAVVKEIRQRVKDESAVAIGAVVVGVDGTIWTTWDAPGGRWPELVTGSLELQRSLMGGD